MSRVCGDPAWGRDGSSCSAAPGAGSGSSPGPWASYWRSGCRSDPERGAQTLEREGERAQNSSISNGMLSAPVPLYLGAQ